MPNIAGFIASIFKPASDLGKSYIENKSKIKQVKLEGKNRIAEAKLNAQVARDNAKAAQYQQDNSNTHEWEMESLKQSQYSWKDEYWTIVYGFVFLYPIILGGLSLVFPTVGFPAILAASWNSYSTMPAVLQYTISCFSLASIGVRYKGKKDAANAIKSLSGKE